jgi:hypothetical protein
MTVVIKIARTYEAEITERMYSARRRSGPRRREDGRADRMSIPELVTLMT